MKEHEVVVVMDFGAQYNQLIARRIREAGVFSILVPYNMPLEEIRALNPKAIILSGGPASVYSPNAPRVDSGIFKANIPILGICYGMQIMIHQLGGRVDRATKREYGHAYLEVTTPSPLFAGVKKGMEVWMSHGDHVQTIPAGFKILARTENSAIAAVGHEEKNIFAVQFHPEVTHTPRGMEIFRNFLYEIAGCRGDWTDASFVEEKTQEIAETVGDKALVCGLSGGVDSAVAARLVQRAVGKKLYCIFVNHGLLREGEAEEVKSVFQEELGENFIYVAAQDRFLQKLKGITDPEEKRRVIGHEFIAVFEEEAQKIPDVKYLVQGTVYSDVIESGLGIAARIKSHHNVGGLPETMKFELIEPLRELFKDEVKRIGKLLGLPDALLWRQPFPGPGLAVRIIGEVNEKNLKIVRLADKIVRDEIKEGGLEKEIWQAFAVLPTTLRSVGVMGDGRTYAYPVVVRAVTSEDAMTASWAYLSQELLQRISRRITNEIDDVNRVLYDITSKPPATIEWE